MQIFHAALSLFQSSTRHVNSRVCLLIQFFMTMSAMVLFGNVALAASCELGQQTPGLDTFYSDSWGVDFNGERFQSSDKTSIRAGNAHKLELKWAYGLGSGSPRSYPLVTEDTIFYGNGSVGVVALDRETGCERWVNTDVPGVATGIVHENVDGRDLLFFSGRTTGVYAVDATSGETVWHGQVEEQPLPMYSGTPIAYQDRVYVPISSVEIGLTINPFYGCCTTSGGMAALDIRSGETLWFLPTVAEEPRITGRRYLFVETWGPSGAPVWNSPMLDVENERLYFGSGQNYSEPASLTSDSIFSVDINTGVPYWIKQFTSGDAYNLSCELTREHPNCAKPMGPDIDFGAPPILSRDSTGDAILLAGQKSGDVYGLSPEDGSIIWQTRFGRGGPLGGVHWGMAANPIMGTLFVPISDFPAHPKEEAPAPGLFAVNIDDGSLRWKVDREEDCEDGRLCWPGLSSGIIAGPDFVVTPSLDGRVEIYAANDGELLWSYDVAQSFESVNGIETIGGSVDAHGPMLADDLLIITSGYGAFAQAGNALLVFELQE